MSFVSHDPAEKAHTVSDLKKIRLYPPPLRNSINRSASKHYSFDRLDAVEATSSAISKLPIAIALLTGYVPKSTVPSACPQYGVRRLTRASLPSIVACCASGAVVRCRTLRLLSTPIVCVGSQPVATLLWLGIKVRPPFCPLFCSFSAFICSL